MAKQPINNGKVVERSYEDYRNNQYLVNRRYQRKLVWELEEKQAFIDSLANGYPVPLFLFAKCVYKGQDRSEIIDPLYEVRQFCRSALLYGLPVPAGHPFCASA